MLELSPAQVSDLEEATDLDDPQEVIDYLIANGTLPKDSTGISEDGELEWEEHEVYEHYTCNSHWAYHFTTHEIFGMTVWPRSCTGQSVHMDGDVVMKFRELHPHLYEDPEAAQAAYT